MAGEIGHVIVAPDGPRCACGLNGCLEAMAAGPAIVLRAQAILKNAPLSREQSRLGRLATLTTENVYRAAAEGDVIALEVTRQAGRYPAHAVHGLVVTSDVERVLFGGGVSRAGAVFLDPICEDVDRLRAASSLAAEVLRPGLLGLVPLDYETALWGAPAVAQGGRAVRGRSNSEG